MGKQQHRTRQGDPLERAADALDDLRDSDDWDVPTSPTLNVHVHERPKTPPAPAPASVRVDAPVSTLRVVFATVQRVPPWGVVLVLVAAIVAYVVLALAGKAPVL